MLTDEMSNRSWMSKLTKISAKTSDITALDDWNGYNINETILGTNMLTYLRFTLGELVTVLNKISDIYRIGMRQPTPEVSAQAAELVNEVQNIQRLQPQLETTSNILTQSEAVKPNDPQIRMLQSLVYSLMDMQLSPQQQQNFLSLASGQMQEQPRFAAEMNTDRISNLLQAAIYSSNNPRESTLVIFREVLQNSADAALSQHRNNPDANRTPSIQVFTKSYSGDGDSYMDMMVVDNGVGMDWETLSQKFFVLGESGKGDEPGATGGFGIAKAKIFETPEHGWSVNTRDIHSSRFGRNLYMGTDPPSAYQPPAARFHAGQPGTAINLYKIPHVQDYLLVDLAAKFATDDLDIIINGEQVAPKFSMKDLQPLDNNLSGLAKAVSDTDIEAEVAEKVVQNQLETSGALDENIGTFDAQGNTSVNFYIRPQQYSGRVYVLLNGQFQFEGEYVNKADLIVALQTTERPGSLEYPVDPGRENLRSDLKMKVGQVISRIQMILAMIGESEVFKTGLDINLFNQRFDPLNVQGEEDLDRQVVKQKLETAITGSIGRNLFTDPQDAWGRDPTETTTPEIATAEQIAEAVRENTQEASLDEHQVAVVNAAIEVLVKDKSAKLNVKEEVDRIIEGVTTPVSIMIQHNFISRQVAHEDPTLTVNLSILWQSIVKKIVDRCAYRSHRDRVYIPGILYSDQAAALYQPAKGDIPYDTIAINPIIVSSIVHPGLFEKWLDRPNSGTFKDTFDVTDFNETPINRLSNLLFNLAIHEVCHMLYPDSYGHDEFHNQITYLTMICRPMWTEIRSEVKKLMPAMKDESMRLMRLVRKERKQMGAFSNSWIIKLAGSIRKFSTEEAKQIGTEIGINWDSSDFPVEEFRIGLEVEMEHGFHDPDTDVIGDDGLLSGKIAWAHLKECGSYYTRLLALEKECVKRK